MIYRDKILQSLLLVRHGEAEHHNNGLTGGWTNSDLTKQGIVQANNNGRFLLELVQNNKVKLFSSDLKRAYKTAEIIQQYLPCDLEVLPELRELNNGIAANMTEVEANKIAIPKTEAFFDWRHYPEGETIAEFYNRTSHIMERIFIANECFSIIVTHNGFIRNALYWWLEIGLTPLYNRISFSSFPASITAIGLNKWHERTVFFQNLNII